MKRQTVVRVAIAAVLVPTLAAGYLHIHNPLISDAAALPPLVTQTATTSLPDFTQLVNQAGPAVVAIRVTQTNHNTPPNMPPGIDPNSPFYDFFKHFGMPPGMGNGNGDEVVQGLGSGFVITPDGFILTNAHVVGDADEVDVKLTDKREFKAKIIGVDHKSDVAVIKIDARGLPTLRIGDPEKLKVGEWVAAIGSPFGLENTVTAGVVSAKARALPDDSYVPFIQTDVAVNPGNSGGPLLNMKGEVVGINSQIFSRTGGFMGLSFAIPIDVAMKVGDELRQDGKVERGRLGVTIQSMTQDLAQSFGLDKVDGALVSQVEQGSPAARAGLKPGDVILAVNDKPVEDSVALSRIVADMKPGDHAKLQVLREREKRNIEAVVGEAPAEQLADNGEPAASAETGKLGVAVRPLNADEQHRIGENDGLLVEQVSGAAEKAGIRSGDVILAINNQRVSDPDTLKRIVDASHGEIAVLVKREDSQIYVPVSVS